MNQQDFEPRILGFLCTWWAYAAADLAGVSRLQYSPYLRVIRVMCSATVSPHHILLAFQQGIDGVFVGGWRLGDCHYLYGNRIQERRLRFLRPLLEFCGLDARRVQSRWVSSAEAPEFIQAIAEFVGLLKELGPSPLRVPDPANCRKKVAESTATGLAGRVPPAGRPAKVSHAV